MLITAFVVILILVALYGYFSSIKMTPLEKDIRKQGVDYECYECKKKFSVNEERCPDCYLITLYGQRKKKYWRIIPIILFSGFMIAKFSNFGLFN
tara:strand:- start:521 stop:805 length:285 start_codon:yes stop_codon:yes gene_type:complete